MAALAFENPVWGITEDEAHGIAVNVGKVSRHYTQRASEEAMDWCGLAVAAMSTYGTRFMVLRAERRAAGAAAAASTAAPSGAVWAPAVLPGG